MKANLFNIKIEIAQQRFKNNATSSRKHYSTKRWIQKNKLKMIEFKIQQKPPNYKKYGINKIDSLLFQGFWIIFAKIF